ncbi:MAG TPA: glycosyltransferase [Rhodobacteraceae bacterium]|nr:glycosyltransferase [Paracoccaceae bacterium]
MIAIVIPVWHHPVLVDEAVLSCLNQVGGPEAEIILVNDGCDLVQTRQSLEGWAAHPNVTLLTQANKGLSAARNTGIEQALKNPACRGVFFLDADNMLDPHAFQLFEKLLDTEPESGWFYPQVDMFGMEVNYSNGNSWALSRLASINCSDAGSLVRREVFESGLRFDTDFKQGFEDWDFWLGAVRQGFTGYPVIESFFRYRKRPESMVSGANRKDVLLRGQLRAKHAWLYGSHRLPDAWNEEYPRFCIISTDGRIRIGSDPATAQDISTEDFVAEVFHQRANPAESRFPPIMVFCAPEVLDGLKNAKILDSLFYQIEGALRHAPVAVVNITNGPRSIRAHGKQADDGTRLLEADMIALSMHHLNAALDKDDMAPIISYLMEGVTVLPLEVGFEAPTLGAKPMDALMEAVGELLVSPMASVPFRQYANWRSPVFAPIAKDVATCNAGGRPALGPLGQGPHVGFAIQVFQFGGVEKCLVALAAALQKQGITCHLFVYGVDDINAAEWMFEPFAKVWILKNAALREWGGSRYMGTNDAEHPGEMLMGDMLGPLTQMDVVVNCGAGVLNHELVELRARGIKVCAWEHITDSTPYGRSRGTPYITLGYEGLFDKILTCSQQLATRMAAFGVPDSKLLPLPNGPGFESLASVRPTRAGPLRVGFLGRFDPQKQVERFVEVAEALRGDFEFHLCGGEVLGKPVRIPEWLSPLPPLKSRSALDAFYASIDVLLMPSRDEGLPLTILEAQRAGVVVLATDVGAVAEAITDGETGVLLAVSEVVPAAIAALKTLDKDRALLASIAQNASGKPDRWQQNASAFIKSLL